MKEDIFIVRWLKEDWMGFKKNPLLTVWNILISLLAAYALLSLLGLK